MTLTWGLAFLLSLGFRVWGHYHPEPFAVQPFLIYILLFAPSLLLGIWLLATGFKTEDLQ